MRTIENILQYQRITLKDAVKAAWLNHHKAHMPADTAARAVAGYLTGDPDEIEALHKAIYAAMFADEVRV